MYKGIEKLYQNSIKGDNNAKEELLIRLKPLILSSIKKYYNIYHLYDDLIQEGYEVILKALQEFDEDRNVYFLGFVKALLKYHYLDKYKFKNNIIHLADYSKENLDIELLYNSINQKETQEELVLKKEELQELRNSLSILTEKQRKIILLYYCENMSIKQIASKLNIAYRTVVNIKSVAISKMKENMKYL